MKHLPGVFSHKDMDVMMQTVLRELPAAAKAKKEVVDDIIEVVTTKGPMFKAVACSRNGLGKAGFGRVEYVISIVNYKVLFPTDSYWE